MDSSKKAETEEKKQESCNATEDKGIDETVSQSVPEKGIDELISQSVPDEGIDEMVSQSVPEKGIDETVIQSVPEKGIDETVSQSVPDKGIDETVSQSVPESDANEKNNTNNSADSSVKTLFEIKKDEESQEMAENNENEESQEKAENNEKVELKETQDLKQANEFDKCRTDSLDDDAKPYNVGMLDERKRDEISLCGESEEGKEVEQQEVTEQEDADKEASDKGKQELNDSQSQNSNKSHCLNQNNYCDDAPKSEVAEDKVEQKENNNGISPVTMEDSREEVQQEKMDDKEQEIEQKETYVNTGNMDLSESMSYENELNVSEVKDKQIEFEDKQIEVEDKQNEVEDKQSEVEDKQREIEDKQSEIEGKQSEVEDKQGEVEDKQSEVEDKQSEVECKQSDVEDKQSEDEDKQSEVEDKQSKVDKTYNDQSEIVSQSAVSRNNELHVLASTSEEEQEKRDRDIKEEKVSKPISDSNNSIGSDENISLNLLNHDSQSMSIDITKHSTGQVNIESIVDISDKSHENSCLKLSDDTTLNIPIEDQTKISINSSSPPEAMDTSEVSITRQSETIVLPDEESSIISKPLFDKIKILKAEENSNTSTGDERSVESIALDNSCLNTPQEENSCLSFPDESSVLSFMDESSGISVPDSEPNFLQYQRRQNLSLFDEAANLSAPDDKCFQRPDTPSSAVTETQDSTPAKKPRRSSISSVTQDITGDDHGPLKAENLYEYQWPQEPDADWYMLQEHVSEFLEVKSFKRKYPDLFRRVCDKHEKDFLREKGVVTETQSDLGLTALKSDEVHDFMARDYPEKYRDYMKVLHEREKQNISNKHRDYEVPKLEKGKIKEYTKKAVKAAAEWNRQFQRERKEERRAYFDVQTFTVHYPVSRYKKLPAEATQVDPYPVSLIPGQFQEYYRRYSKEELKYFPLNTALFDPPKKMGNNLANPADADSEDPEEEGKQAGSGSESDSGDDSTSNSDDSSNSEEIPMEVDTPKPESSVSPKLEPDEAQCRICKTKAEKKKKIKKKDEELVQCSECKSLGHPSCLDLTNKMIAVIKTYPWQCMECKTCVECMDPYDEDKMMFCDRCDRGYHTFCVGLKSLPTGKWECVSCKSAPSTPKATPKSTTKSKRGRKKENGK